jgi:uncharacterized protein (TIGR02646 family)
VIKIERIPEPSRLAAQRDRQLAGLGATCPERTAAHSGAYQSVKRDLVTMQRRKCCYCERRTIPDHNDVEHYRPFLLYWWLAWTWENLLFACASCNRKGGKLDAFPLADGSTALSFPEPPPGGELPLLLDPTVDNPRDHLHFVEMPNRRWMPVGKTDRGRRTIEILGLSRDTYLDEFGHHVQHVVMPVVRDLKAAYVDPPASFATVWSRKCTELLDPERSFLALSEDVLRHEFPSYPDPPPGK